MLDNAAKFIMNLWIKSYNYVVIYQSLEVILYNIKDTLYAEINMLGH